MWPRKKREKVVAEIATGFLMQVVQEQGRHLDHEQAVNFLKEGGRAYALLKEMMYAGENYIKSVLATLPNRTKMSCSPIGRHDSVLYLARQF